MEIKTLHPFDKFFLGHTEKQILTFSEIRGFYSIILGIAIGLIAWDSYLPIAIFIPVIWAKADNRKIAWMVGLGYHLAASRGLIAGVSVFFDSTLLHGFVFWAAAGLIQSIPYFLCTYIRNSYLGILSLLILLILPPVGIVGWVCPLTAAGVLFPGTGFMGLFLTILLIFSIVWQIGKNKTVTVVLLLFLFLFPLSIKLDPALTSQEINSITTNFVGNPGNIGEKFERDFEIFSETMTQYSGSEFKTIVLPESTGGIWIDSTRHLWGVWQRCLKKDQSIILPTLLPDDKESLKTHSVLIEMKMNKNTVLYKARQPVPFGMWKPWAKEDVKINWFTDPIFEINNKKATALICYEAYLTWPILHSFLAGDPEIILFVSNHWWSKNTSLLSIQKTCTNSWARLFNAKLVTAINL